MCLCDINCLDLVPPVMVSRSVSFTGIQSHEMAITCQADGLPAPKYEFTKVCIGHNNTITNNNNHHHWFNVQKH